jgi:predicted aspartyl protease
MNWTYRRYAVDESRICPSGMVYRPEAKIRVRGSQGEAYLRALLDTGADHTVLPFSIAADIGAELFEDEADVAKGVGGHE